MKCTVCRGPAVIDLRRHNANFCGDHFIKFCRDQVARAIHDHAMLGPGERVLVAVSGGKDSLALWDMLLETKYDVDGMTIGLGIGDYSSASTDAAVAFAESRGVHLQHVDLRRDYDYDIPTAAAATRRQNAQTPPVVGDPHRAHGFRSSWAASTSPWNRSDARARKPK